MKIFIAAGHGGGDPGAVALGTSEAAEVIHIVDKCVDMLKEVTDPEHEIVPVDSKFNLQDEVAVINDKTTDRDNDIAIEVHLNANSGAPGTGTEVYYGNKKLAEQLYNEIVKNLGLRGRGVKEGNYLYFNNASAPQSALVELGFINNESDLAIVREKGAAALARAITTVCGLSAPAEQQPAPITKTNWRWVFRNFGKIIVYFEAHPEIKKTVEEIL